MGKPVLNTVTFYRGTSSELTTTWTPRRNLCMLAKECMMVVLYPVNVNKEFLFFFMLNFGEVIG